MKAIKDLMAEVRRVLARNERARDNDRALLVALWYIQDPFLAQSATFSRWATDFVNGKYVLPGSVTRTRRSLQEVDATLRGKHWNKQNKRRRWRFTRKQVIEKNLTCPGEMLVPAENLDNLNFIIQVGRLAVYLMEHNIRVTLSLQREPEIKHEDNSRICVWAIPQMLGRGHTCISETLLKQGHTNEIIKLLELPEPEIE